MLFSKLSAIERIENRLLFKRNRIELLAMESSHVTKLMRDTFSTVHLKNCEIYPDQLHFQEQIGEGKFGVVYKGIWKGRACAIKKLKTGISKESVQYQRQLIELGILACVGTHPNIVGFWGACIQDISSPLIVEELVDGMNLEEILSRKSIGFNLGRATVKVPASIIIPTNQLVTVLFAGSRLVPRHPPGSRISPRPRPHRDAP